MKRALKYGVSLAFVSTACQGILGIEDGTLDPDAGSGGGDASGGSSGSGGAAAGGGGTTSPGGSGGSPSNGGTGGQASGGDTASGGGTSDEPPDSGDGGTDASSGGTTSSGGATSSGGTTATGGATATGGRTSTGGATATGGVTATGGAPSTGGVTNTCSQTLCGVSCVNTATSADHCGLCNHGCFGGTCSASKCQPKTIVTGENVPSAIAANAAGVYWLTGGTGGEIRRAASNGSGVTTLGSQMYLGDVAADGAHAYWFTYGSVYQWSITGGTPVTIGGSASIGLHGLAVDAIAAYYPCNGVCKAPLDGRGSSVLQASVKPIDIAAGSNLVFWLDDDRKVLESHSNGSGSVNTLMTGLTAPRQLAVYGGSVYFTDGTKVSRISVNGGGISGVATGTAPDAIAADPSGVYWIDGTGIYRWNGASSTVIATDTGSPSGIAVSADSVYWSNGSNGTISRLAKP